MITPLVFTDGRRNCIERTLDSARFMIRWPSPVRPVIVNDSEDPSYQTWLERMYPHFKILPGGSRRGFCGAIQAGWSALPADTEWIFHLEDDFLFNRRIDIAAMIETLEANPKLVQLALKRQPWNEREKEAGDLFKVFGGGFLPRDTPHPHLVQRIFWTTNPSLYHRRWTVGGFPSPPSCEGVFSHRLLADPDVWFGYWGHLEDEPWVTHIGDTRAGEGY